MKKKVKGIETTPFGGGADIRHQNEPALIPSGGYSAIQNMRNMYPGLKKRTGCSKLHVTNDGTNKVMSMYQFVKGKKTERHFYAQMSDSDVLEAYGNPPTIPELMTLDVAPATAWADGATITGVTSGKTVVIADYVTSLTYIVRDRSGTFTSGEVLGTGIAGADNQADQGVTYPAFTSPDLAFGNEVFSGTASPVPASWGVIDDTLVFSNGVDQHQIYPGNDEYVKKVVYVDATSAVPTIPDLGTDYTEQATDGLSTTVVPLDSMVAAGTSAVTIWSADCEANTGWTGPGSTLTPTAGGQAGNCFSLANSGAAAGWVYLMVSVIVGISYTFTFYFKKGTGVSGKVYVGSTIGNLQYYNSGSLTDANWAQKTVTFTATTTTAYISLFNNSAVSGETSLYDTFLLTRAAYQYVYIRTDIPANAIKFTVSLPNGSDAVALIKYWNGAWTTTGMTDGTIATAGKTLGQTESMAWTLKTDEYSYYMFDEAGFWYQLSLSSGALDSEVEISSIQYNTIWQSIQNVWDGVPPYAVEASFYDQSATTYLTYGSEAVTVSAMTTSDIVYFNSSDPIVGFYVDVGATPNTTATTTINLVNYFDGIAMKTVGTIYDGTGGLRKSGWVTFGRQADVQPRQFNDSYYFSYWYSFTVDKTLSASLVISIETMPYFKISEFGSEGLCNCSWHDRMLYVFARYPSDIVVSKTREPMVLNGDEFTILESPADGRKNRVVCMRNIGDDLLVWQEEKGREGGTLTKYSWVSSISDVKKTTLSSTLGTMNNKSVDIVDSVEFAELNRDIPVMTLAFCLSRSGVYVTEGVNCYMISRDIANYFDPNDSTCIRVGYEAQMWLKYDSAYGVVRLGIVSGSSAILPNVFPVYDVKLKAWTLDSLAQEFACITEVEAASGNIPIVQIGGGIDDGFVYLLNTGTNDVTTAIDSFVTVEFDAAGNQMCMNELLLRVKAQSTGSVTVTPYINGQAQTAKTLLQTAVTANDKHRRHRDNLNIVGDHISLKYQHSTASEGCYLLDYGTTIEVYEEQ